MDTNRDDNVVGALALALSDGLLRAAEEEAPASTPAAAIAIIGHAPGVGIGQLGRVLGLSHAGAVRLVDRLEGESLASRSRSSRDGRSIALTLTRAGRRVCKRIHASRGASLDRALDGLSRDERRTFGRLAEKMLKALLVDEQHAFAVCRLCDPEACTHCPVEAEIVARERVRPVS